VEADWLDADLLPFAEKAREAALCEVDAFGLVRNVCGAPYFDSPGVAPEGQAFHILMEAARRRWLR
ncbi:MAG: glycosyl hydrolase, partial [Clostridia bacterium]|nr:glycosyl hydrolase [Clostridia bacterium]